MTKEKILLYHLSAGEKEFVKERFDNEFDIIDESSCFLHILVIPAKRIYVNPRAVSEEEMEQMNEMFEDDTATEIIFTKIPKMAVSFQFKVESTVGIGEIDLSAETKTESDDRFFDAVDTVDMLLDEILKSIQPGTNVAVTSKSSAILEKTAMYRQLMDSILRMDELELDRRQSFGKEIVDMLLAMQVAYGMIDENTAILSSDQTASQVKEIRMLTELFQNHWMQNGLQTNAAS